MNRKLGSVGQVHRRPESETFFHLAKTAKQAILALSSMEPDAARRKKGRSKPGRVFRQSLLLAVIVFGACSILAAAGKPRVIVTSDGEIDDQCSMIRFMLYTNECDVEGIISSSSQYHSHGHNWAGDDWIDPDLAAYARVYPNLVKHDPAYPTPEYLRERVVLGNVKSEGDSPAFLHTIVTGLRNMESPDWGGWGGRYVRVRENTWLDPVPVKGYTYPEGRWYGSNGWGRNSLHEGTTSTAEQRREYFKPMWRWTVALQNDFAARADWCVKPYKQANHPPKVVLGHAADLKARPGESINLSAKGTSDPDGDKLTYRWWQYEEADTYEGTIEIPDAGQQDASFKVPDEAAEGETIHIICEVTDSGTPPLTRYQRVVVELQ